MCPVPCLWHGHSRCICRWVCVLFGKAVPHYLRTAQLSPKWCKVDPLVVGSLAGFFETAVCVCKIVERTETWVGINGESRGPKKVHGVSQSLSNE